MRTNSIKNGGQPMNEVPTDAGREGTQSASRWADISPMVIGTREAIIVPTPQKSTNIVVSISGSYGVCEMT
jgi:hypothetical protein